MTYSPISVLIGATAKPPPLNVAPMPPVIPGTNRPPIVSMQMQHRKFAMPTYLIFYSFHPFKKIKKINSPLASETEI